MLLNIIYTASGTSCLIVWSNISQPWVLFISRGWQWEKREKKYLYLCTENILHQHAAVKKYQTGLSFRYINYQSFDCRNSVNMNASTSLSGLCTEHISKKIFVNSPTKFRIQYFCNIQYFKIAVINTAEPGQYEPI